MFGISPKLGHQSVSRQTRRPWRASESSTPLTSRLRLIELATTTHARNIDEIEGAPPAHGVLRLALEVSDTAHAVEVARQAGANVIAPPVRTPFRSLNARVQGPSGWQVTFFQEEETLAQRAARDGFTTDGDRAR